MKTRFPGYTQGASYGLVAIRFRALVLISLGLLACDEQGRKEPSPAGMCRELRDECRGLSDDKSEYCFKVGAAGAKDPSREDHCFAVYPACIEDCYFLRQVVGDPADAQAAKDAGSR